MTESPILPGRIGSRRCPCRRCAVDGFGYQRVRVGSDQPWRGRIMSRGFTTINFYVDDALEAVEWYGEVLGLKPYFAQPSIDEPAYVEFRVGDHDAELGLISSRYRPAGHGAGRPAGAVMYGHVDDVSAAVERLRGSARPSSTPDVSWHRGLGDRFDGRPLRKRARPDVQPALSRAARSEPSGDAGFPGCAGLRWSAAPSGGGPAVFAGGPPGRRTVPPGGRCRRTWVPAESRGGRRRADPQVGGHRPVRPPAFVRRGTIFVAGWSVVGLDRLRPIWLR
ncbi:hypothetical protein C8E95_2676 [Pseudonocardia autotrophica]|uniref:Glyoxalase/fosfomycin resistance/dioxygenase domain-containing protein n=1 Tax=Pseudonocardia autotrophica TaxID=2074 RepID=A0A1Y2N0B3_PSEAH|nr:hypothetical protein BG845_02707 [Pseudonocardia autotrophica]TDN73574.1 hypothetical protein C8E95_2676 [Pseudonocardia autotrophica]